MAKSADGFELHPGMQVYLPGATLAPYVITEVIESAGLIWTTREGPGHRLPFDADRLYVSPKAAAEKHAGLMESNARQATDHARRARQVADTL